MSELDQFAVKAKLSEVSELERVIYLAFFALKRQNLEDFDTGYITAWLQSLNFARPNATRLRAKLDRSKDVVKGKSTGYYKISRAKLSELESSFPELNDIEVVQHTGSILPEVLYKNTRGYIESLASQINASYESNIFDGCAVLMRRLMEILLILSFEHHGLGSEIKGADGNYFMLDPIITKAKNHATIKLSRNSRDHIETFRVLGNFSAHKIHYTCRRDDIKKVALDFRALFEELLYKSGIRV